MISRLAGRRVGAFHDAPPWPGGWRAALVPSLPVLVVGAMAAACGKPSAMGEANSLIVVAPDSVWRRVEDITYESLERTVFTTRDEKIFNVTYVGTESPELGQLLLWRQVIVFAPPGDSRLERVAGQAGHGEPAPGDLFQAGDVWARGQVVTAVVLEPERQVESWRESLPELASLLEERFREYTLTRMFVSGIDSATADFLREAYGVSLHVPRVYQRARRDDDIVILRNDNPEPSELIRSVLLQRRDPSDSITVGDIVAWRKTIDSLQYNVPQSFQVVGDGGRPFDAGGYPGLEIRGVWQDEGTYPAAGPFIARAVLCPGGTFFIDAWLYSPNPRRSKWEYLMQLEEIMDSFRCEGD